MAKVAETFVWQGADRNGKKTKGEINATSVVEAKNMLRRQGVSAKSVKKQPKPLFSFGEKKVTAQDVSLLSRQIATMLNAGVTLIQSLEMIGQGSGSPAVRKMMAEITNEVRSGNTFNSALRKYPRQFDELYCDLVETGEQSGSLEGIFDRIALYKEKAEALKSKIKKAMFYPIAVLVVAFVVTVILLVYVVPQFEEIFSSFGAELPAFTQFVLGISNFVQDYGPYIALGMIGAAVLFVRAHRASPKLRDSIDAKVLKIPVIGEILKKASIARFSRTLSTTFAAGVPLIGALDSASGAAGNAIYRDAILYMRKEVSGGIPMNSAMRSTNVFPSMVVQMVAIGEESGSVDEMLGKIATIYEAEVDDMVDGLTSLLEPMIMAVLGVVIGGLIIAMYLPIFEMGSVV
ncbi:type II secretion system F family protein [Glaciecola siphonariae]|uniref:Type II secretion system F family protein n=1 Tax=Glaciecola siphonariae TaxID=521012 RepID=A0ABV9LUS3_9ALTE